MSAVAGVVPHELDVWRSLSTPRTPSLVAVISWPRTMASGHMKTEMVALTGLVRIGKAVTLMP